MGQISERKRVTLEFFEQLNEPERSEAIENFNEGYYHRVPDTLGRAILYGFSFKHQKQPEHYWNSIYYKVNHNTYHTKPFDIEELAREMYPTDCLDRKVVVEVYNKLKELGLLK